MKSDQGAHSDMKPKCLDAVRSVCMSESLNMQDEQETLVCLYLDLGYECEFGCCLFSAKRQ